MTDRLAERLALVAVGRHVVQCRLRRTDCKGTECQGRIIEKGRKVEAISCQTAIARNLDAFQLNTCQPTSLEPHARLGTATDTFARRIDDKQRRAINCLSAYDQSTGSQTGDDQRLLPIEQIVLAALARPRRGLTSIGQYARLCYRQREAWHALFTDKCRQPGSLLRRASPAPNAIGGRQRNQQGRGQRKVALRQALGDQRVAQHGALPSKTTLCLGNTIVCQAQFMRLIEQCGRHVSLGVGPGRSRAQNLQRKALEHVYQHLLLFGQ